MSPRTTPLPIPQEPLEAGHAAFAKGEYAKALTHYEKVRSQKPDNADMFLVCGLTLQRLGRNHDAKDQYAEAVRLAPLSAKARVMLAAMQMGDNEWEAARDSLLAAVKQRPGLSVAHFYLGQVFRKLGDATQAEAHLKKASVEMKDFPPLLHQLGAVRFEAGDREGALKAYQAATKAQPKDPASWTSLGLAYAATGDYRKAIEGHRRAAELSPKDPTVFFRLGWLLERAGQLDSAITAFREAIKRDAAYVPAHLNLGMLLGRQGDIPGANACMETVLKLQPGNADAKFWLGIGLQLTNQPEAARARFAELVAQDPHNDLFVETLTAFDAVLIP